MVLPTRSGICGYTVDANVALFRAFYCCRKPPYIRFSGSNKSIYALLDTNTGTELPVKIRFPTIQQVIDLITSGSVTAEDLFYSLKDRITDRDGPIGSFVSLVNDFSADLRAKPSLRGLPFSVKDIIDTKGIPTSYGSPIFSGNIPGEDAFVVKRLKEAGGLIQGKTSTHEFAMGIVTPQSRNPWDTSRITGGSSGGSAAAVAAGFSLFALGTDTAGSIRIPSGLCGVTGLKPTTGRLSLQGIFPESWSLDSVGPICRHASDIPFLLDIMGYSKVKPPHPGRVVAGVITQLMEAADPEVRKTFNSFLDTLTSENLADIQELSVPELEHISSMDDIVDSAENATVHRDLFREHQEKYTDLSRQQLTDSARIRATDYIHAIRERERVKRLFNRLHRRYVVFVSPLSPTVAPPMSEIMKRPPSYFMKFMAYTNPFNFSGEPAISIPVGFQNGLPVSAQISAGRGEDVFLCDFAASFQNITEHHLMFPDDLSGGIEKSVLNGVL